MKNYQISFQLNINLSVNQTEIWINAIYAPNLLSVWQIHFKFEHFNATVPISVISMKDYQISLQLTSNYLRSIWNMNEYNICNKFIERLTNTLRIWTFHCNCLYISHFNSRTVKYHFNYTSIYLWIRQKLKLIQLWTKFIERLSNILRIWTFHCNCLYNSHFNEELSNIISTTLQFIYESDRNWN